MDDSVDSISGRSAALYFADDPSLAHLLVSHGISIRDFILVSFLADQGPLSIERLARIMWIEPHDLRESVVRLASAGLVIREPESNNRASRPTVRLTSRGQEIAARIDKQL